MSWSLSFLIDQKLGSAYGTKTSPFSHNHGMIKVRLGTFQKCTYSFGNTVKPVYSRHPGGEYLYPLLTGVPIRQVMIVRL